MSVLGVDEFYFDRATAVKLLKWLSTEVDCCYELDAFGDFLRPLGEAAEPNYIFETSSTSDGISGLGSSAMVERGAVREKMWNLLHGTPLHVLPLMTSKTFRLSSPESNLRLFCADVTFASLLSTQRILATTFSSGAPVPNLAGRKRGRVGDAATSSKGAGATSSAAQGLAQPCSFCSRLSNLANICDTACVLDHCRLDGPVKVGHGSILSHVQLRVPRKSPVLLPDHLFMESIAVHTMARDGTRETIFVTRFYSTRDDLAAVGQAVTLLGVPIADVLHLLGLSDADIWPVSIANEPRTLRNASIFPLAGRRSSSASMALKMIQALVGTAGGAPSETVTDSPAKTDWVRAQRISMVDALAHQDLLSQQERRNELSLELVCDAACGLFHAHTPAGSWLRQLPTWLPLVTLTGSAVAAKHEQGREAALLAHARRQQQLLQAQAQAQVQAQAQGQGQGQAPPLPQPQPVPGHAQAQPPESRPGGQHQPAQHQHQQVALAPAMASQTLPLSGLNVHSPLPPPPPPPPHHSHPLRQQSLQPQEHPSPRGAGEGAFAATAGAAVAGGASAGANVVTPGGTTTGGQGPQSAPAWPRGGPGALTSPAATRRPSGLGLSPSPGSASKLAPSTVLPVSGAAGVTSPVVPAPVGLTGRFPEGSLFGRLSSVASGGNSNSPSAGGATQVHLHVAAVAAAAVGGGDPGSPRVRGASPSPTVSGDRETMSHMSARLLASAELQAELRAAARQAVDSVETRVGQSMAALPDEPVTLARSGSGLAGVGGAVTFGGNNDGGVGGGAHGGNGGNPGVGGNVGILNAGAMGSQVAAKQGGVGGMPPPHGGHATDACNNGEGGGDVHAKAGGVGGGVGGSVGGGEALTPVAAAGVAGGAAMVTAAGRTSWIYSSKDEALCVNPCARARLNVCFSVLLEETARRLERWGQQRKWLELEAAISGGGSLLAGSHVRERSVERDKVASGGVVVSSAGSVGHLYDSPGSSCTDSQAVLEPPTGFYKLIAGAFREESIERSQKGHELLCRAVVKSAVAHTLRRWGNLGGTAVCVAEPAPREATVALPIVLDLSGGWTTYPPYCMEQGGTSLGLAIMLDGQLPVRVTARCAPGEPLVRLHCKDAGMEAGFATIEELFYFSEPDDPLRVLKAAVCYLLCPELCRTRATSNPDALPPLDGFLHSAGFGRRCTLSITSEVGGLPSNTCLGASSLVALATYRALRTLQSPATYASADNGNYYYNQSSNWNQNNNNNNNNSSSGHNGQMGEPLLHAPESAGASGLRPPPPPEDPMLVDVTLPRPEPKRAPEQPEQPRPLEPQEKRPRQERNARLPQTPQPQQQQQQQQQQPPPLSPKAEGATPFPSKKPSSSAGNAAAPGASGPTQPRVRPAPLREPSPPRDDLAGVLSFSLKGEVSAKEEPSFKEERSYVEQVLSPRLRGDAADLPGDVCEEVNAVLGMEQMMGSRGGWGATAAACAGPIAAQLTSSCAPAMYQRLSVRRVPIGGAHAAAINSRLLLVQVEHADAAEGVMFDVLKACMTSEGGSGDILRDLQAVAVDLYKVLRSIAELPAEELDELKADGRRQVSRGRRLECACMVLGQLLDHHRSLTDRLEGRQHSKIAEEVKAAMGPFVYGLSMSSSNFGGYIVAFLKAGFIHGDVQNMFSAKSLPAHVCNATLCVPTVGAPTATSTVQDH